MWSRYPFRFRYRALIIVSLKLLPSQYAIPRWVQLGFPSFTGRMNAALLAGLQSAASWTAQCCTEAHLRAANWRSSSSSAVGRWPTCRHACSAPVPCTCRQLHRKLGSLIFLLPGSRNLQPFECAYFSKGANLTTDVIQLRPAFLSIS